MTKRLRYRCQQFRRTEGLLKTVDRTKFRRHVQEIRRKSASGIMSGNDNDRHPRPGSLRVTDNFQPIHIGHEKIDDQQIELSDLKKLKTFSAILSENDLMTVALEHDVHGRPNRRIIVDNQNICHTAPGSSAKIGK
jgi:hypothetical protein